MSLILDPRELEKLAETIDSLEKHFGADYTYEPAENAFSCSCSGPAQSCIWH